MTLASVMYPLKDGSPKALTTADITDTDTQLYISDLSVLPAAPNLLVIYTSPTVWERCKYTLKQSASGAGYVNIVRSGDEWASSTGSAQSFATGAKVARNVFKPDFDAIQANVTDNESRVSTLDGSVSTLEGRMDTLDGSVSTLEGRMDTLDGSVSTLEGRMDPIVASLIFG